MTAHFLPAHERAMPASAEEQLSLVLTANPGLAPEGWCDDPGAIADAVRSGARPGVILRPKLVEAFAWCQVFLALGCRRTPITFICGDKSTRASRLAFDAEMAGLAINGRALAIEQGVAIAAALSLGIEIERRDADTWIGAHAVRKRWR